MYRSHWILGTFILFAATASLEAAYIIYEGDVFPENDGWIPGGSQEDPAVYTRSLANGVFRIDATPLGGATVFYRKDVELTTDTVAIEWRARTSNDDGYSYQDLLIGGEDLTSDISISWRSSNAVISLARDVGGLDRTVVGTPLLTSEFHTFRIESFGALFSVYIDGELQVSDTLQAPTGTNLWTQFGFGKDWYYVPTAAEWDYIRIDEVPEPSALLVLVIGLFMAVGRRCSRQ
ncbi:MAG TPA: PEP-CTERM sorting domain-containing protein [Phycisphaerae bacterium]|nr:PEP-CTERM sorting domain-containing protein [Phycisphaerae bacterium]HRR86403.1 PEP-CTERM sorting domain-containing protein [Phycisphaerae bacterium]